MSESTNIPTWDEQPDGSRVRVVNGIRIVDRTRPANPWGADVQHLVAKEEPGGQTAILGLDAECRVVYVTTLFGYL